MDTVVIGIEDMERAPAIADQGPRVEQMPFASPTRSPAAERFTVAGEFLHAMISVFANKDMVLIVEDEIVRIIQLARRVAWFAPVKLELPFGIKDLDSMVAGVGDPDPVLFVDCQVLRSLELARRAAMFTPLEEILPIG